MLKTQTAMEYFKKYNLHIPKYYADKKWYNGSLQYSDLFANSSAEVQTMKSLIKQWGDSLPMFLLACFEEAGTLTQDEINNIHKLLSKFVDDYKAYYYLDCVRKDNLDELMYAARYTGIKYTDLFNNPHQLNDTLKSLSDIQYKNTKIGSITQSIIKSLYGYKHLTDSDYNKLRYAIADMFYDYGYSIAV